MEDTREGRIAQFHKIHEHSKRVTKFEDIKTVKIHADVLQKIPELRPGENTNIDVWNLSTEVAGKRLYDAGIYPLILNMANHKVPGGGVRNGARAQEEHLCRFSNLYLHLTQADPYPYPLGPKEFLVSRYVDFFYQTYRVDVLSMAACIKKDGEEPATETKRLNIMKHKIMNMFEFAVLDGQRNLVLGAFGCGAFHNEPEKIVEFFNKAIKKYGGYFDNIIFAVIDDHNSNSNYSIFNTKIRRKY
jgi:hypothetical protein